MELIFKHSWILFITFTVLNGLVLKFRSKKHIDENPELTKGYENYFKGYLFYANIPWIIMMVGALSGLTQNTFDYFNPRAMNPIVLIFHFSLVILWILSVRWIYFKKGAEFIEKHPGLFYAPSLKGNSNATARQIKLVFPIMLLGGLVGILMMWTLKSPDVIPFQ